MRPKLSEETATLNIMLIKKQYEKLGRVAHKHKTSRSDVIRLLIEHFLP